MLFFNEEIDTSCESNINTFVERKISDRLMGFVIKDNKNRMGSVIIACYIISVKKPTQNQNESINSIS